MEVLGQEIGIDKIADLFVNYGLVPIFGSGFTRGNKSLEATVPDGVSATQLMKKIILEHCNSISENDIVNSDFNHTSKLFYKLVPLEIRNGFFKKFFTFVDLDDYLKDFLSLPWSYAYTLNIDDGIERTGSFEPVLPYKNLNRPDTSMKLLYKLHGDALTEVKYKGEENIVFSHEQYITSITSDQNTDFLNHLVGDFTQKNLIYIGCSLINEPDLKFVFNKIDNSYNISRIYLTSKELSFLEKNNLEEYGVNTVVTIKDYHSFYRELTRIIKKKLIEIESRDYKFINPKIVEKNSIQDSIDLISGIRTFDENNNIFNKSGLQVLRSCIVDLEDQLQKYGSVVVKGRRFSGKTTLLSALCERQKTLTFYFFPSTSLVDEQLIFDLFSHCKRSLFVFDSNSLSNATYRFVANSQDLLKKNYNKIVVATNSSDSFIADSLNSGLVEVSYVFDKNELKENELRSNNFGLINRRWKNTNIDYLMKLSNEQKVNISLFNSYHVNTYYDKMLLLLLCASDKVYLADAMALGISPTAIKDFLSRFPLLVEEVSVDRNESSTHSSTKIVHNSKMAMISILDDLSKADIIDIIKSIIDKTKRDRSRNRMHVDIILFDTLNQLFGSKKGAGYLIFQVYESIESRLSDSMHYWLQRAKSVYRLFPEDKEKLDKAYTFAKKSYADGNKKIKYKAALTTALICCLLYQLEREGKDKYFNQCEAILLGYEALFKDSKFNYKYIKSELKEHSTRNSGFNLLTSTCNDFTRDFPHDELAKKANNILERLDDLKKGV